MTRALDITVFKGWTVLQEWSKNQFFHKPNTRGALTRYHNRVRAYYSPPNSGKDLNVLSTNGVKMTFAGIVNGLQAQVLLDTGASHAYLSLPFAR